MDGDHYIYIHATLNLEAFNDRAPFRLYPIEHFPLFEIPTLDHRLCCEEFNVSNFINRTKLFRYLPKKNSMRITHYIFNESDFFTYLLSV